MTEETPPEVLLDHETPKWVRDVANATHHYMQTMKAEAPPTVFIPNEGKDGGYLFSLTRYENKDWPVAIAAVMAEYNVEEFVLVSCAFKAVIDPTKGEKLTGPASEHPNRKNILMVMHSDGPDDCTVWQAEYGLDHSQPHAPVFDLTGYESLNKEEGGVSYSRFLEAHEIREQMRERFE